ncbi:MAG TPA: PIG-L family deacetylase [Anaerolineales bacterium]|nr:PIG-L family deacetylase [Anaerolineales bacterium]
MALRVYLSPHLDDAVFSCGGLIARQISSGDEVQVVTVFSGDPPVGELSALAYELHRRWGGEGSPMGLRRAEDLVACGRLGASVVHLGFADAIYRRGPGGEAFHPDVESLFLAPSVEEEEHIGVIGESMGRSVAAGAEVYVPLGVGSHVDHLITRRAAERAGRVHWYYREVPYILRPSPRVIEAAPAAVHEALVALAEPEIEMWAIAAGEYHSQISSFWSDVESLDADLRSYHDRFGGLPLLRRVQD